MGVFIGIQVANWNEARGERADAVVVLDRLEQDFEQILERADQSLDIHDQNLKAAGRLILGIRNQALEEETLLADIGAASNFSTFPGTSSTFTQLVSSGRLELIRSQELRRALTEYHAYLDFAQSQYGDTFVVPLGEARRTLAKATLVAVTNSPSAAFGEVGLPDDVDRNMLLTEPDMLTTLQVCYQIQDNIHVVLSRSRGQVLAILEQIRTEQETAR